MSGSEYIRTAGESVWGEVLDTVRPERKDKWDYSPEDEREEISPRLYGEQGEIEILRGGTSEGK